MQRTFAPNSGSSNAASANSPTGRAELRKFIAPTMAECLNRVKSELGPGAVILSTRSVQSRRLLGLIRQEHVEITAGRGLRPPQRRRPSVPRISQRQAYTDTASKIGEAFEGPGFNRSLLNTPAAASAAYLGVTQEVGELKKLVADLVVQIHNSRTPELPETLAPLYRRLIDHGTSAQAAGEIAKAVKATATPEQLADAATLKKLVLAEIERRLPVCGPTKSRATGRPHVVALIGPTGVGKTTTIAKLAATLKLKHKATVALITIDTYRIAAIDQLRKYAEIIESPLTVVSQPQEIRDAIARLGDHDYVLIDTAGRSPRDAVKLRELQQFLEASAPDETHLVLSTTCGRDSMKLALQRFAGVRADKLVFTKLDESAGVGACIDIVADKALPISYVTAGQDVPADISIADPAKLARIILGDN